ncbi:MAG TPA: ribosomal protein S18-alanine N-acetyltransferase [bacterium]|jgi:ribosomal-protein-alanine acetyltransferase|nr:ribosomal protein S18-alanine N-acetyltransferase [bacterium]HNZ53895.1 ribosomal protein S18-alanine N-acetyltransferase [bacterium]HOB72276.1 ribosomal protein S18-alanine N-acetyltransferase [bacterium]HOG43797.1 ribosomal protein S18-alanine N-acetyltransferase [bacterium]HPG35783.1 ribosomal protein S18-alanine N-acetyltransferase [bacterium]
MILSKKQTESLKNSIISIGLQYFGDDTGSFLDSYISAIDTQYIIFCHLENGLPEGFLILSEVLDEAEIIQVAVRKESTGRGIGTQLVKEVAEYCKSNGVRKIFLEVRVSNRSAEKIYLKNGFEKVGMRRSYYSNPVEDALIMAKSCCGWCQ